MLLLESAALPTEGLPSSLLSVGQIIYLLLVFIIVILLAYYATKMLGKARHTHAKGNNLSLIETMSVGMQSSIQLIKAGEQFFLIAVTKDKIAFLTEVDKDGLSAYEQATAVENSFDTLLAKQIGRLINRKKDKNPKQGDDDAD